MFRWLAAVITILVVTLGAWAPTRTLEWPTATADFPADRDAVDPDLEDPEPEGKATLSNLPALPAPLTTVGAATRSQRGARDGAAFELEEPPRA